MSYEKIKPGHPAYKRVRALLKAGHFVCAGLYHNAPEGCNNPFCWEYNAAHWTRVPAKKLSIKPKGKA